MPIRRKLTDSIRQLTQRALLEPQSWQAHFELGNALLEHRRFHDAIIAYERALMLRPGDMQTVNNLGTAHRSLGCLDQAIAYFQRALAIERSAETNFNLGSTYLEEDRFDEAKACFHQALQLQPAHVPTLRNLGFAFMETGYFAEAIDCYQRLIAISPDHPQAHRNLGIALLTSGRFHEGWREYEWRRQCEEFATAAPAFPHATEWSGGSLENRTLFLYAEQGLGDAIQFIRYVPLLSELGAKIIVGCHPDLKTLLQGMPSIQRAVSRGERIGRFDLHLPLLSVARVLDTSVSTIPNQMPYLFAPATRIEEWSKREALRSSTLKVGIAWAGSASHPRDSKRSISLPMLAPLASMKNVTFFSLQKGDRAEGAIPFYNWTNEFADMAATAGLIHHLDLVISVDTAVAHLAGAMGKPVWTLLPCVADWRWFVGRDDSPWYPTMRLFRQTTAGDWRSVIAQVREDLVRLTQNPARQTSAALGPGDSQGDYRRANSLAKQGRFSEAVAYYRRALQLQPNYLPALANLGNSTEGNRRVG